MVNKPPGRPKGTGKGGLILSLSEDERDRLFREAEKEGLREEVLIKLIHYLALRVSEAVTIETKDFDLSGALVVVTVQGVKHGLRRSYPLPERLSVRVRRYLRRVKGTAFIFPGRYRGEPLSTISVQKLFYRLRDQAGLDKKFSIHSLRHTRAMEMVQSGISPVQIQDWLRQRRIDSAMAYFRLGQNEEFKLSEAERLNGAY